MANKYWAAGVSGNWNNILSWSDFAIGTPAGALVPGAGDAAIFNAASGTVTATLDISPTVQTLTMTGFTGTLAFGANTISLNSTGTIFTGATTMTVTGTPQIICTNSSATARTITPTAVTEANSISFRITAGTGGLTLSNNSVFRNLDFTDGTNPTGYAGLLGNPILTIYGNFKASTGMTKTAGTGTFTFAATSGTKTITTAAVVFDNPFTFNGVGGSWQLQDALTSGAGRTTTLTNGALDLNGNTLTTGIFSSSNANARTLDFGDVFGNIVITGNNTTVFNTNTATNLTIISFGGQKIIFDYAGGVGTRTITGASIATAIQGTNLLDYLVGSGSDIITLTGNCAYNDVDFNAVPSTFTGTLTNSAIFVYNNFSLSSGMTLTAGANAWTFKNTSMFMSSGIILTSLKTIDNPIIFDGIGGSWLFFDALTLGSTRSLTFTNGAIRLFAGSTNTVGSFVTTGTTAKYLGSTTLGTQATISAASGINSVSYLTIQDSNATGGATFDALAITNVDAGNNTGWLFSTTPSIGNEITMRLRSFTQPRRF